MAVIICPHCGNSNGDASSAGSDAPEESTNGVPLSEWSRVGIRVAQASGMVAAQAGCSPDAALGLMKKRAEATGSSMKEIADAVLERKTRFA